MVGTRMLVAVMMSVPKSGPMTGTASANSTRIRSLKGLGTRHATMMPTPAAQIMKPVVMRKTRLT